MPAFSAPWFYGMMVAETLPAKEVRAMLPKAKTIYFHVDVNSAFLSWTAIQHLCSFAKKQKTD